MSEDGTRRCDAPTQTPHPSKDPHPNWCQPDECTIESGGTHGSFCHTVHPDDAVHTVIYLWANQQPGAVQPPKVEVEISDYRTGGETVETFPLTPAQLRHLHEVTGELLTALARE
jgi:hypothetical protein